MTTATETKTLQLGDTVPNFTAQTTEGEIDFHNWLGDSWGVFFSHPKDFTPVCTTELGEVAKLGAEWKKRNVKVLALSVDGIEDHKNWIKDINETQSTTVNYPIVADSKQEVANLYGMIHPNALNTLTVRSVFIINPDKKLVLTLTYPASTGRNFNEILRVLDSLQLTAYKKVATPVNWKNGDDCVIVPAVQDEAEIKKLFPKGYKAIKPYLRLTPQPDLD
jgi:alkyl hydroperoxide reductase subunit AhpC